MDLASFVSCMEKDSMDYVVSESTETQLTNLSSNTFDALFLSIDVKILG
jgi:hypothetical protein